MSRQISSTERRTHQRRKISIGANIDNFSSSYFTHLRDISRGGAFVHTFTEGHYKIGQELILTLPMKSKDDVRLETRVAWTSPDGIGLKFIRNLPAKA